MHAVVPRWNIKEACPQNQIFTKWGPDGKEYVGCQSDCRINSVPFETTERNRLCCLFEYADSACEPSFNHLDAWIGESAYTWPHDHRALKPAKRIGNVIVVQFGADI